MNLFANYLMAFSSKILYLRYLEYLSGLVKPFHPDTLPPLAQITDLGDNLLSWPMKVGCKSARAEWLTFLIESNKVKMQQQGEQATFTLKCYLFYAGSM